MDTDRKCGDTASRNPVEYQKRGMLSMAGEKKKWTVMAYLAGDNNLDENGITDLGEMKKAGSTKGVNVIAEFDRAGGSRRTSRYFLRKGTSLASDVVQSLGEIDTGDPRNLIDFIQWGAKNYPAERYLLVLWNHGAGWDDKDVYGGARPAGAQRARAGRVRHAFFKFPVSRAVRLSDGGGHIARAILFDDSAKDFLDNVEMKKALTAAADVLGQKIDLVGMDACLMSMAEVGYQMRDCALFSAGSEETEPLNGWPYDRILKALVAEPDMKPEDLARVIVQRYIDDYKGGREYVTQSALNLGASVKMAGAVKALAAALTAGLETGETFNAIAAARGKVQIFDTGDNVDLLDLCSLLREARVTPAIGNACDSVLAAAEGKGGFVLASGTVGAKMKNSRGAAIYFPTSEVSPLYAKLDFDRNTGWGKFLKAYVARTRSR
jgi:hypothetical protein